MATMSCAQTLHAESKGDAGASAAGKNKGTLKTGGTEHSIYPTEGDTSEVSKFLQTCNQQESLPETLLEREITPITPEMVDMAEIETEIDALQEFLENLDPPQNKSEAKETPSSKPQGHLKTETTPAHSRSEAVNNPEVSTPSKQQSRTPEKSSFSSIFDLASSFLRKSPEPKKTLEPTKQENRSTSKEEGKLPLPTSLNTFSEKISPQEKPFERDGNGKQGRDQEGREKEKENQEGFSENQQRRQQDQQEKKEEKKGKIVSIQAPQAARNDRRSQPPKIASPQASKQTQKGSTGTGSGKKPVSIENVYIRFMALMARILGQAEQEAHQLYLRIKERTDNIDLLTLLMSKINSEKGAIDWTNNEEMKKLIERVRALGVEIPEGKYTWTDEEKKVLKENIQMRKDSMEKITQLERTDMQRYLQEASQCHQARSNVLKLLKEVIDTIIHNFRPG